MIPRIQVFTDLFVVTLFQHAVNICRSVILAYISFHLVVEALLLQMSVKFEFGADLRLSSPWSQPEVDVFRLTDRVNIQSRVRLDRLLKTLLVSPHSAEVHDSGALTLL